MNPNIANILRGTRSPSFFTLDIWWLSFQNIQEEFEGHTLEVNLNLQY